MPAPEVTIARVDVLNVTSGAGTATARLHYIRTNGTTTTETAQLRFVTDPRTGKLLVNLDNRMVMIGDQPVRLTSKEYALLELLSLRKGAMLSKEVLLDHLYGDEDEAELKLRVFVHKLRKNLAEASGGEDYIETVRGLGYTLRDPVERAPEPQGA